MAGTAVERRGQRRSQDRGERNYRVKGTLSIAEARAAAYALDGNADWEGLAWNDLDVEEIGFKTWDARASYSKITWDDTAVSDLTFDTSGGTANVIISKETIAQTNRAGGVTPDFNDFIGVEDSGSGAANIKGVDRVVPVFSFDRTVKIPAVNVDASYVGTLFALTGTVCDAAWDIFAKGEVLYRGTRGTRTGNWFELAHMFSAAPNRASVTVDGLTVTPAGGVEGWHYLWTYSLAEEQTGSGQAIILPKAKSLVVSRVYDYEDFDLIGAV